MLKEAKSVCDYLIVGLQTDPTIDRPEKNKPIQSVFERFVQLDACKYVDEVIVYATEKDLLDILHSYPINVRIVGDEYREKDFTGNQVSQKRTTILVFTSADKVGKFFALRMKAGGTFMEEIFDLKVSKDEDAGLALWTVSPSAPNVFSSFFMDVYFSAGSSKFDKVLLGIPTRQASVPFGMALASSGLK